MPSGNYADRELRRKNTSGEEQIKDAAGIGLAVRHRRQDLLLTQADAAALCKVGTRFLSELENGKASLQLGKVLQVLRAFGLLLILRRKA